MIDFAADLRAPTPTAAAEMAVPVRHELLAQVIDNGARMTNAVNRALRDGRVRLDGQARGLPDLRRLVEDAVQRLDDWGERLGNSLTAGLNSRRAEVAGTAGRLRKPDFMIAQSREHLAGEVRALKRAGAALINDRTGRLGQAAALLESFSYERILERGFALVTDRDGQAVASARGVAPGDDIGLRFADGGVRAVVSEAGPAGWGVGPKVARTKKPASRKASDERQGKLL